MKCCPKAIIPKTIEQKELFIGSPSNRISAFGCAEKKIFSSPVCCCFFFICPASKLDNVKISANRVRLVVGDTLSLKCSGETTYNGRIIFTWDYPGKAVCLTLLSYILNTLKTFTKTSCSSPTNSKTVGSRHPLLDNINLYCHRHLNIETEMQFSTYSSRARCKPSSPRCKQN